MKIVKTREGNFWRTERGKKSGQAPLNDTLERNKNLLVELSPRAAAMVHELKYYLNGLRPRRITIRVKSCLQRSLKETGGLDYVYFRDFVFQPDYPITTLLRVVPTFKTEGDMIVLQQPIPRAGAVLALNKLVTAYRLSLIMLVGDVLEGVELSTYVVHSPVFETGKEYAEGCELRMKRPVDIKWMAMLRIVSYEGKEVAANPRHAGMVVVGWG